MIAELRKEIEAVQTRTQREMSGQVSALTEQLQLKETEIAQLSAALQEYSRKNKALSPEVVEGGVVEPKEEEVVEEVVWQEEVVESEIRVGGEGKG